MWCVFFVSFVFLGCFQMFPRLDGLFGMLLALELLSFANILRRDLRWNFRESRPARFVWKPVKPHIRIYLIIVNYLSLVILYIHAFSATYLNYLQYMCPTHTNIIHLHIDCKLSCYVHSFHCTYYIILYYVIYIILYFIIFYYIMLYRFYYIKLFYFILCFIIICYTLLYYTISYYIILYYIILYYYFFAI